MAKYNRRGVRAQTYSPVRSARTPSGTTFEGHPGYDREPKGELFLLATNQFMGEDAFYESAKARDNRLVNLTRQVAVQDPAWVLQMVRWLRTEANMRSVSLVIGLEAAKAVLDAKITDLAEAFGSQGPARQLAKAGILRADEPGEALAYWMSKYGRNIPAPIKRAIADKATELYTERNLLKWDTPSHGFRFADVIDLTHPTPNFDLERLPVQKLEEMTQEGARAYRAAAINRQSNLFRYALDRRHGRETTGAELPMVTRNRKLRTAAAENPQVLRDPERLREAGMTWEDVLSLAGDRLPKKELWKAIIPSMGYMALLRNLRNFDQAGVSDQVAEQVAAKLADPQEVARSRQLPMRFLTAFTHAPSLRWAWPLEQALNHCLANVPQLSGRTLVLVDTSGSMNSRFSQQSTLLRWDVASLFGLALAGRAADADLVSFSGEGFLYQRRDPSTPHARFALLAGQSLLAAWSRWNEEGFNLNGGTDTARALRDRFAGHDRVVILTDEQAAASRCDGPSRYFSKVGDAVPATVPMHVINVAGYEKGMVPSGQDNRHVYAGLTDHVFKQIQIVEAGVSGTWPWIK